MGVQTCSGQGEHERAVAWGPRRDCSKPAILEALRGRLRRWPRSDALGDERRIVPAHANAAAQRSCSDSGEGGDVVRSRRAARAAPRSENRGGDLPEDLAAVSPRRGLTRRLPWSPSRVCWSLVPADEHPCRRAYIVRACRLRVKPFPAFTTTAATTREGPVPYLIGTCSVPDCRGAALPATLHAATGRTWASPGRAHRRPT